MKTKRSRITSFSLKIAKCPHTFLHILRRFFNTPHNRCFPPSTLWHFTRRFLKLCYFESFNARHSSFHDDYSFLSPLFPSFAFFSSFVDSVTSPTIIRTAAFFVEQGGSYVCRLFQVESRISSGTSGSVETHFPHRRPAKLSRFACWKTARKNLWPVLFSLYVWSPLRVPIREMF